jgi:hypothetical protein
MASFKGEEALVMRLFVPETWKGNSWQPIEMAS